MPEAFESSLRRRDALKSLGVLAAGSLAAGIVRAQPAMKIIVSFAPGGDSDRFARLIADRLGKRLGRSVIIDNKPGAGGILAARTVMAAPADGNTLLVTGPSLAYQSLRPTLGFDLRNDLAPIIMSHTGPHTLYVNATVPAESVADLVRLARNSPGKMAYGSWGIGSQVHIATELFLLRTGARMIHASYRSNAECITSVLKGETQFSMNPYTSLSPFVREGKVRPLAVSTAANSSDPRLPGMAQSGIKDYDVKFWVGFHAPLQTPAAVLDEMNGTLNAVLQEPEVESFIATQAGASPIGGSRLEFADWVRRDLGQMADTVRAANISLT